MDLFDENQPAHIKALVESLVDSMSYRSRRSEHPASQSKRIKHVPADASRLDTPAGFGRVDVRVHVTVQLLARPHAQKRRSQGKKR